VNFDDPRSVAGNPPERERSGYEVQFR